MKKQLLILFALTCFLFPAQSCFAGNILEDLNAALTKLSNNIPTSQKSNTVERSEKSSIYPTKAIDPSGGNSTMNQLLIKGVETNDLEMVKLAISKGANANIYTRGDHLYTVLSVSIGNRNYAIRDYLINNGADVNARLEVNGWGNGAFETHLNMAVYAEDIDSVRRLIEVGADVNLTDKRCWRPLGLAIIGNCPVEIIQLLIDKKAEINYHNTYYDYETPLLMAIKYNRKQVVQILLNAGADPQATDKKGENALNYAIRTGDKELINMFLSK